MPNDFIELYDKVSNTYTRSYATKVALDALKTEREGWKWGIRLDSNLFRVFYNPITTASNLASLKLLRNELEQAIETNDVKKIAQKIKKYLNQFSTGDTKALLAHILNDINNITYTSVIEDFQLQDIDVDELLTQKKLNPELYRNQSINFAAPLSDHVAWAFDNIYSVNYPGHDSIDGLARYIHGIQHVARSAMYAPVIVNLYRKYNHQEAEALNDDDLKLIQLAIIFHDAAREDENRDRWDLESATMLFKYLYNVLNIPYDKAAQISEAMANKDLHENKYFALSLEGGKVKWKDSPAREKNIYQKIIHDADCLDIIRARPAFDAEYLDFYQDIAKNHDDAFKDMRQLIVETRSIIVAQGDEYEHTNSKLKSHFETNDAYEKIHASVNAAVHPLISSLKDGLFNKDEIIRRNVLIPQYDAQKGFCQDNLTACLYSGDLIIRAIDEPSKKTKKGLETLAELELRKVHRRYGIATQSKKINRFEKEGNLSRSVSVIGYGSHLFANAGFGKLGISSNDLRSISIKDSATGHGKKKSTIYNTASLSEAEKNESLSNLKRKMQMGGDTYDAVGYEASHIELTMDIFDYEFIAYSNEHNLCNYNNNKKNKGRPFHEHAPVLEAIYLQSLTKQIYNLDLPIVRYDASNHQVQIESNLTSEKIIQLWTEMCCDYIDKEAKSNPAALFKLDVNQIKIAAMYGSNIEADPADKYLDTKIIEMINNNVEKKLLAEKSAIYDQTCHSIKRGSIDIFENNTFSIINSIKQFPPDIELELNNKLNQSINTFLQTDFQLNEFKIGSRDKSAYLPYIQDNDSILKIEKELIEKNSILKLLKLSERFEMPNRKDLREKIRLTLNDHFDQLKNKINIYSLEEMIKLAVTCKAVGMLDEFKMQFVGLIQIFLTVMKNSNSLFKLQDMKEGFDFVIKLGLGGHLKNEAKSYIENCIQAFTSTSNLSNLFSIYYKMNVDDQDLHTELYEKLVSLLKYCNSYNTRLGSDIIGLLLESQSLNSKVIFQMAIDKIEPLENDLVDYFPSIVWVLNRFRVQCENGKFSDEQQQIINNYLDKATSDFIAILANKSESSAVMILTDSIIKFAKEDAPYMPFPKSLLDKFQTYLEDQSIEFTDGEVRKITDAIAIVSDNDMRLSLKETLAKRVSISHSNRR